jgi:hypothetical protein
MTADWESRQTTMTTEKLVDQKRPLRTLFFFGASEMNRASGCREFEQWWVILVRLGDLQRGVGERPIGVDQARRRGIYCFATSRRRAGPFKNKKRLTSCQTRPKHNVQRSPQKIPGLGAFRVYSVSTLYGRRKRVFCRALFFLSSPRRLCGL